MAFALPRFRKGNLHAIRPGAVPGANILLTWNCTHTPGWPPSHAHQVETCWYSGMGSMVGNTGVPPRSARLGSVLRHVAFHLDTLSFLYYNKNKGNTVSRRLALRIGYRNSRILWPRAAISYCSETGQ